MCQDGQDNDGDGVTDCADEDCWPLKLCAASRPDGWKPPDSGVRTDAPQDAQAGSCSAHCDCAQGEFCYKGKCLRDKKQAVYCCAKDGCPPGAACVDLAGQKASCMEDPGYPCQSACDCGPAHCCIDVPSLGGKRCVKDTKDTWRPGGTAVGGASCSIGQDATYCCAAPECHAGRSSYAGQARLFRCHDETTGAAVNACGGKTCLGSACDCGAGEVCVDTTTAPGPPAGASCHLGTGGACVSWAAAEAIFGWQSSDLLPCCEAGCAVGSACDLGWKHLGSEWAYQRVVGTCGPCADGEHYSCGKCGDGTCDAGEYPGLCPADCRCGDGQCAPEEAGICEADCGSCGDGRCDADEPRTCEEDCSSCGDGWCSATEYLLGMCGQDCWGACEDVATFVGWYQICGDGFCSREWLTCPEDCTGEAGPGPWVSVPAGAFSMGSPATEPCRNSSNEDQHSVTLTRGFEIQSTEVTQAQFAQLMGYNPADFPSCGPDCPVEHINWYEAAAYCNQLSHLSAGLGSCYQCMGSGASVMCWEAYAGQSIYDCPGYRLPTEAEWEYAYRAGTTTAYYSGANDPNACSCQGDANLDPIAWYCANANGTTHPVGSKQPNAWGIHDMAGNVLEWCNDWFQGRLGSAAVTDPFGAPIGDLRVIRGGAYYFDFAALSRAASRGTSYPTNRLSFLGFRCVKSN